MTTCNAVGSLVVAGRTVGLLHCDEEAGHTEWREFEFCYEPDECGRSVHEFGGMSATHPEQPATPHRAILTWSDEVPGIDWPEALDPNETFDAEVPVPAGPIRIAERCPECKQGKHGNCDGRTWDNAEDRTVPCPCSESGHIGAQQPRA